LRQLEMFRRLCYIGTENSGEARNAGRRTEGKTGPFAMGGGGGANRLET